MKTVLFAIIACTLLMYCEESRTIAKNGASYQIHDQELFNRVVSRKSVYFLDSYMASDDQGFLTSPGCDSMLHTGLTLDPRVDLGAACNDLGKCFRTPKKDCYATGRSGSEFSRDMALGMAFWSLMSNEPDTLDKWRKYVRSNGWVFCDGDWKRCYMTPQLWETTGAVLDHIAGIPTESWLFPIFLTSSARGYVAHLQMLHCSIRWKISGVWDQECKVRAHEHYARNPQNPIFAFVSGQWDRAAQILNHEPWYPYDRLPESKDQCAWNLMEREYGSGYKPCDRGQVHGGVEVLFLTEMMGG